MPHPRQRAVGQAGQVGDLGARQSVPGVHGVRDGGDLVPHPVHPGGRHGLHGSPGLAALGCLVPTEPAAVGGEHIDGQLTVMVRDAGNGPLRGPQPLDAEPVQAGQFTGRALGSELPRVHVSRLGVGPAGDRPTAVLLPGGDLAHDDVHAACHRQDRMPGLVKGREPAGLFVAQRQVDHGARVALVVEKLCVLGGLVPHAATPVRAERPATRAELRRNGTVRVSASA